MMGLINETIKDWKDRLVVGLILLFFVAVIVLDHINGRFWLHDFKVYYLAAQALFSGNIVYEVPFGLSSGYYKYSPVVLTLFYPFSILPYYFSSIIFYVILSLLNIKGVLGLNNFFQKRFFLSDVNKQGWLLILLIFIVSSSHIHRELHLGNINIFLLVLFLIALKQININEKIVGGCLIGLGILFKPHFLIIIPLIFLWRMWRVILGVIISMFIGFVIPGLIFGWAKNFQLHNLWFKAISDHNADILDGINTMYYYPVLFLDKIGMESIKWMAMLILILVALGVGGLHFYIKNYARVNKSNFRQRSFQFEYFLLIGLIPSLTITDTEHFLLSMPLVVFCLYAWQKNLLNNWMKIVLVIGLVMYGSNWGDLVGEVSILMSNYGLLGIGNILIIGISLGAYIGMIKKPEISH